MHHVSVRGLLCTLSLSLLLFPTLGQACERCAPEQVLLQMTTRAEGIQRRTIIDTQEAGNGWWISLRVHNPTARGIWYGISLLNCSESHALHAGETHQHWCWQPESQPMGHLRATLRTVGAGLRFRARVCQAVVAGE